MAIKGLQMNLNNSWRAQDLMIQLATEERVNFCAISEPAGVMDSPLWNYSNNSKAALYVPNSVISSYLISFKKTLNSVSLKFRNMIIISIYISPNVNDTIFRSFLDEVGDVIVSGGGNRVLLCGDFNAFSTFWGSSYTNHRGTLLENWAFGLGLCLVNIGSTPTCLRAHGSSTIDLTWASSNLIDDIEGWRVREELESLSDHQYISFRIGQRVSGHTYRHISLGTRWNFSKINEEIFTESIVWSCSVNPFCSEDLNLDPGKWIDDIILRACEASTPKIGPKRFRKCVYWWNSGIASLRRASICAKRTLTRGIRRNLPDGAIERLRNMYKRSKRELVLRPA